LHLHDNTFSYYDFNPTARYKRVKKTKSTWWINKHSFI
jgi:hypothetical protein